MRYDPPVEERPSLHERLASAFQSSDLSVDSRKRTDADFLAALGFAQQRRGVYGGAVRLLMSRSQADLKRAAREVTSLTMYLNAKGGWRLAPESCRAVAELAVRHYVDPACPHCHGRGRDVPEGAPYLGANLCKHCGGLGKRPIQKRWRNAIRAVLTELEGEAERTLRATGRALQ